MVIKGKKAILFTVMSLTLSALFLIAFSAYFEVPIDQSNQAVRIRVLTLDKAIESGYEYADKASEVAGHSALDALFEELKAGGSITNFSRSFIDCAANSTGCNNSNNLSVLLDNYAQSLLTSRGINLDIRVDNFDLIAEDHWELTTLINITIYVNDTFAQWKNNRVLTSKVSILGLRDPAYLDIDFGNPSEERVIISNINEFGNWNFDRFNHFYYGKEYIEWSEGPCFSHRFTGDYSESSSVCGLASLVNANEHPLLLNPTDYNITHLDYQVLRASRFPCNNSADVNATPRVSIRAVNVNLTITQEHATHFGLANNSVWYYDPGIGGTTALGCPGFS